MIVAGPMPCHDCGHLVVYGRRMDRGNPPRSADTYPKVLDAKTRELHRCTAPDTRPEDPLTRRITR